MSKALKRVEAWLLNSGAVGWTNQIGRYVSAEDLRAVLVLAKEAAELKSRLRRTLAIAYVATRMPRVATPLADSIVEELTGKPKCYPTLAQLRKPLPRSRR